MTRVPDNVIDIVITPDNAPDNANHP